MKTVACLIFEVDETQSLSQIAKKMEDVFDTKILSNEILNDLNWQTKLANIFTKLGANSNCGGYILVFDIVEAFNTNPCFTLCEIYQQLEKKYNIQTRTLDTRVRYFLAKILEENSKGKIAKVLGIKEINKEKLLPKTFFKLLVQAVF